MELRTYQRELIDKIRQSTKFYKSIVAVLGCGGG